MQAPVWNYWFGDGEETPEGKASIQEILHDMPIEASMAMAHGETVGACAVATLAAVNVGLGTCLRTIGRRRSPR